MLTAIWYYTIFLFITWFCGLLTDSLLLVYLGLCLGTFAYGLAKFLLVRLFARFQASTATIDH